MIGLRHRVALTVLVVTACLYSMLAAVGFLAIANGSRNAIRERVGEVLDQLEGDLRAHTTTVRITTPDGVVAVAGSPSSADVSVPGTITIRRDVEIDGERLSLVGRASQARLTESLRSLHRGLWIGVPLAVLVTTSAAWLAVGRSLRPVSDITRLAGSIGASDLSRRVPVPDTEDEVAELARTVNAMLDRIEAGRLAQHRFTSDAAHELRTPLMVLRGEIELARRPPSEGTAEVPTDPELLDRLDAQCRRLSVRVDDLVLLSTLDEHPPITTSSIDLVRLVRDEAPDGVEVIGDDVLVSVDERLVRRAVSNLFSNARRHATSEVRVTVEAREGRALVHVDDDGPGIAAEDRERVLARFGRLDDARTADTGGSGLGLAIVASVAAAHGGGVSVDDSPLGGARVSIWLPLDAADAG